MNERWLSVAEIAAHLGVNPDTIYKWIVRKGMPGHKVARLWKFMISEVDAWVRAGNARRSGVEGTERNQHNWASDITWESEENLKSERTSPGSQGA